MKNRILRSLSVFAACCMLATACTEAPETAPDTTAPSLETSATSARTGDLYLDFQPTPTLKDLHPGQRVTFRPYWNGSSTYDGVDVKIEVTDLSTGELVPFTYEPGYYRYYFFTEGPTVYEIKLYVIEHPEISVTYPVTVTPGVHMKLVSTGGRTDEPEHPNVWISFDNIHFFADRECTQRIDLPYDMLIRVHLFKKAIDLFPTSMSIYRDETFMVQKGWPDIQRERLVTIHETLPSGETLDDYYEIEVIQVQR